MAVFGERGHIADDVPVRVGHHLLVQIRSLSWLMTKVLLLLLWFYVAVFAVFISTMSAAHSTPGSSTTFHTAAIIFIVIGWLLSSASFARRRTKPWRSATTPENQAR